MKTVDAGDSPRLRVLCFGEGVSLAHVGRPLELARALDPARYEIHFASSERYRGMVEAHGFVFHPVDGLPPQEFMARLAAGAPLYDEATLRRSAESDLRVMQALRPDLVIGDFRVSLGLSAVSLGIPHANLCNAHWSPWSTQRFPAPDLPVVRMLGERLGGWAVRLGAPTVFRLHAAPFNRLRKAYGLPPVRDLRAMYALGDWTLYLDLPDLAPVSVLPVNHRYLGPVTWSPALGMPEGWGAWRDARPLVYITLGSSGEVHVLPELLRSLEGLPVQAAVATAGRVAGLKASANVLLADYLPGSQVLAEASACIFNGGAATGYQALEQGVPVLGLPSNADQFFHMQAIAGVGAGLLLRAQTANSVALKSALSRLLNDPAFAASARRLAAKIKEAPAAQAFRCFMQEQYERLLKRSAVPQAAHEPARAGACRYDY